MKRLTLAFAMLLLLVGAMTVQAQDRLAIDLRGGGSYPTSDLGQTSLKFGGGFGATASVQIYQHMWIYGGWDWTMFKTDGAFEGAEYDVNPNGYAFGFQFQHAVANSVYGWLKGGTLYNHVELEDNNGTKIDSGHEFGFELGTGLRAPLGDHFAITPGFRYRQFSADLVMSPSNTVPVDIRFISGELGLSFSFGANPVSAMRR